MSALDSVGQTYADPCVVGVRLGVCGAGAVSPCARETVALCVEPETDASEALRCITASGGLRPCPAQRPVVVDRLDLAVAECVAADDGRASRSLEEVERGEGRARDLLRPGAAPTPDRHLRRARDLEVLERPRPSVRGRRGVGGARIVAPRSLELASVRVEPEVDLTGTCSRAGAGP